MEQIEETAEDASFREEARAWLAEHAPAHTKAKGEHPERQSTSWREWARAWQSTLVDGEYAAITWPRGYGGRDGTTQQQKIFDQEARAYDLPIGFGMSIERSMVAPTILTHGTDEQKERFILPILRGDERWCQLFSEPGAGSDLAGVTCRAERDGDEWIVNGQKVWTSMALDSEYGILLARTDLDQPKHRGISYFLIDMNQPGVDIRPLRQITGDSEFNEVFLTDARVPHENLLGGLGEGWRIAQTTLANERVLMGSMGSMPGSGSGSGSGRNALVDLAQEYGVADDSAIRSGVVDAVVRSEVLRFLGARMMAALKSGKAPGPESSVMKLFMGQSGQVSSALALEIQGSRGLLGGKDAVAGGSWQYNFLRAPSVRIAGGSDQIQRNIIGERVLGLPAEPRIDKDVPFRDVPKNAT